MATPTYFFDGLAAVVTNPQGNAPHNRKLQSSAPLAWSSGGNAGGIQFLTLAWYWTPGIVPRWHSGAATIRFTCSGPPNQPLLIQARLLRLDSTGLILFDLTGWSAQQAMPVGVNQTLVFNLQAMESTGSSTDIFCVQFLIENPGWPFAISSPFNYVGGGATANDAKVDVPFQLPTGDPEDVPSPATVEADGAIIVQSLLPADPAAGIATFEASSAPLTGGAPTPASGLATVAVTGAVRAGGQPVPSVGQATFFANASIVSLGDPEEHEGASFFEISPVKIQDSGPLEAGTGQSAVSASGVPVRIVEPGPSSGQGTFTAAAIDILNGQPEASGGQGTFVAEAGQIIATQPAACDGQATVSCAGELIPIVGAGPETSMGASDFTSEAIAIRPGNPVDADCIAAVSCSAGPNFIALDPQDAQGTSQVGDVASIVIRPGTPVPTAAAGLFVAAAGATQTADPQDVSGGSSFTVTATKIIPGVPAGVDARAQVLVDGGVVAGSEYTPAEGVGFATVQGGLVAGGDPHDAGGEATVEVQAGPVVAGDPEDASADSDFTVPEHRATVTAGGDPLTGFGASFVSCEPIGVRIGEPFPSIAEGVLSASGDFVGPQGRIVAQAVMTCEGLVGWPVRLEIGDGTVRTAHNFSSPRDVETEARTFHGGMACVEENHPALELQLLRGGKPADLVCGAISLTLLDSSGRIAVQGRMEVVDHERAIARYEWQPGDTAVAGKYTGFVTIDKYDGALQRFPSHANFPFEMAMCS